LAIQDTIHLAQVRQVFDDDLGRAASQDAVARPGSRMRVRNVGAPTIADAMIAAAHKTLFARMYFRFMVPPVN